jgi:hypothetical protein
MYICMYMYVCMYVRTCVCMYSVIVYRKLCVRTVYGRLPTNVREDVWRQRLQISGLKTMKSGHELQKVLDTKTGWLADWLTDQPTDRQS